MLRRHAGKRSTWQHQEPYSTEAILGAHMSYDFAFRVIDLTTMVATAQLKCPTYPTDVDESKQLRQIWSQTKKDASG
jgi:hypothetical protein